MFLTLVLSVATLVAPSFVFAQQAYMSGQTIAPAYEGWERNDDGSFTLVFGYMNRNWEEVIDVPIGPENSIEPGRTRPRTADALLSETEPVHVPDPRPGRLRRQGAGLDADDER